MPNTRYSSKYIVMEQASISDAGCKRGRSFKGKSAMLHHSFRNRLCPSVQSLVNRGNGRFFKNNKLHQ